MPHELCRKFAAHGNFMRGSKLLSYEEWSMLARCLLDASKQPREDLFDEAQVLGRAREMERTYRTRLPETKAIAKLRDAYYSGLKKLEAYESPARPVPKPEKRYYWQDRD